MRKYVACLIFAACVTGLGHANAAYVIRLKNGNEFVTARYWQKGAQIMFDTYGGVFGVDRSLVTKILQSDKPIPFAPIREQAPEEKPKPDAATVKTEQKKADKPSAPQEAKSIEKSADDPIQKEFNTLKAQSGDISTMLTADLGEYLKQLAALKNKIQLERKINQYIREYTDLVTMADAAEAALRSRR